MILSQQFRERLFKPVDASSLVVFRIGFGLVMLWEVFRYWSYGWINRYYIEPAFQFKYYGFEWVTPWPGDWMYVHFALLGICAVFITIGLFYRISSILFLIAFSYVFLLEQANYLNHLYLVIICAVLICIIPANRYFSIDAKIKPAISSNTVPVWSVWILRAQFEIVLLYAGIVKINSDWLQLEPLSTWLAKRADLPFFGPFFTQDWSVGVAAYGVILLHMIGAPLLFYRRTRIYVFSLYACFHILNHFVFSIGIFPWFTLMGSLIFFDPDWPKQLWLRILAWKNKLLSSESETHTTVDRPQTIILPSETFPSIRRQNIIISFLGVWLAYQILMPVRHILYPGNVSWTEEGHKYSWQMKLRDKRGKTKVYIIDTKKDRQWEINPRDYLSKRQARKMAVRPELILQFAHRLAQHWETEYKIPNVEVRVHSMISLNGRKKALLIDPEVDLTKKQRSMLPADWILPLNVPLTRDPEKYREKYKKRLGIM